MAEAHGRFLVERIIGHVIHPAPEGSEKGTTPTVTFYVRWAAGPEHDEEPPLLADLLRDSSHLVTAYLEAHPEVKRHWLVKQRANENALAKAARTRLGAEALTTATDTALLAQARPKPLLVRSMALAPGDTGTPAPQRWQHGRHALAPTLASLEV